MGFASQPFCFLPYHELQDGILSLSPVDIISPVPLEHWDLELLTQVSWQPACGAWWPLHFSHRWAPTHTSVPCTHSCFSQAGLPARFGGFLPSSVTDGFDLALFGLSGGEAELMDPQQRLLLDVVLVAADVSRARSAPGLLVLGDGSQVRIDRVWYSTSPPGTYRVTTAAASVSPTGPLTLSSTLAPVASPPVFPLLSMV